MDYQAECERLRRENEKLRKAIRNQAGDNLCWLDDWGLETQIPPRAEFLESCSRYHQQLSSGTGQLNGCMTIAQLEARIAELEAMVGAD